MNKSVVSGIVDDAPGAAVGEDEGGAAGTADSVAMVGRDAGTSLQYLQGGEGGDVVFVVWAPFDGVEAFGTLGDEADGGIGRGEVDSGHFGHHVVLSL